METSERESDTKGFEAEPDCGKPLLIEWMDSEWFQVWLKLARHEQAQAA